MEHLLDTRRQPGVDDLNIIKHNIGEIFFDDLWSFQKKWIRLYYNYRKKFIDTVVPGFFYLKKDFDFIPGTYVIYTDASWIKNADIPDIIHHSSGVGFVILSEKMEICGFGGCNIPFVKGNYCEILAVQIVLSFMPEGSILFVATDSLDVLQNRYTINRHVRNILGNRMQWFGNVRPYKVKGHSSDVLNHVTDIVANIFRVDFPFEEKDIFTHIERKIQNTRIGIDVEFKMPEKEILNDMIDYQSWWHSMSETIPSVVRKKYYDNIKKEIKKNTVFCEIDIETFVDCKKNKEVSVCGELYISENLQTSVNNMKDKDCVSIIIRTDFNRIIPYSIPVSAFIVCLGDSIIMNGNGYVLSHHNSIRETTLFVSKMLLENMKLFKNIHVIHDIFTHSGRISENVKNLMQNIETEYQCKMINGMEFLDYGHKEQILWKHTNILASKYSKIINFHDIKISSLEKEKK